MVDSVHVGLVTPRWAIGGRKNNGMLGDQHSSSHKFDFCFNFNLFAAKAG